MIDLFPSTTFLPKDRDGALQMLKELLYDRLQELESIAANEIERTAPSFDEMLLYHHKFVANLLDLIERS